MLRLSSTAMMPPERLLGRAAWMAAALLAVCAIIGSFLTGPALSEYFLHAQDVPVIGGMVVMLAAVAFLARRPGGTGWPGRIAPGFVLGLLVLVVLFAWAGHYWFLHDHDLTVDEQHASFAARHLAQGRWFVRLPPQWESYGFAMKPQYLSALAPPGVWLTQYLPVNSAFQAVGIWLGDQYLVPPLLMGAGLGALWIVTGQLWRERMDVRLVVMGLALTSAQMLLTAMTAYAMTGHFALNMIWLALFLHDRRWSHAVALLVGFLAVGLHQLQFHPMFVAPFVARLFVQRRWALGLYYAVGYAVILLLWDKVYPAWISDMIGQVPAQLNAAHGHLAGGGAKPSGIGLGKLGRAFGRVFNFYTRLSSLGIALFNFLRFVSWQNAALMPLFGLAAWAAARHRLPRGGILAPLLACAAIGLCTMVYQAHGWGYRYMHGLLGPFALIGGYGWQALGTPDQLAGARRQAAMLFGVTLVVLLPVRLWQVSDFVGPYARSYRAIRAIDADVVLLDHRYGFFAGDLVDNDPNLSRPKIMQLSYLRPGQVANLCARYRVAVADAGLFLPLGIRPVRGIGYGYQEAAERRAQMAALGCGGPR